MAQSPASSQARQLGKSELGWYKALSVGSGIAVLGLHLSKPLQTPLLQKALHTLQTSHPLLRSKIHHDPSKNTFHFLTPPAPTLQIHSFDLPSTAQILQAHQDNNDPFHALLHHQMNSGTWRNSSANADVDVLHAATYAIAPDRFALILRVLSPACDRDAANAVLRELVQFVGGGGVVAAEEKVCAALEDLIPKAKRKKAIWTRGMDMIAFSLNSMRLSHLSFHDVQSPRTSRIERLKMDQNQTNKLLAGCKSRGIKLCSALAAAGMIASWASKSLPDSQKEKYGVVTLTDCRPLLDPRLATSPHPSLPLLAASPNPSLARLASSPHPSPQRLAAYPHPTPPPPQPATSPRDPLSHPFASGFQQPLSRLGFMAMWRILPVNLAFVVCFWGKIGRLTEAFKVVFLSAESALISLDSFHSELGFYLSAILNTHDVGRETLWELANKNYTGFVNAMKSNKHFTDMSDLNYLMSKAIENPSVTPSSSHRIALISVFEDPFFDDSTEMHEKIGLEDYVVCASSHGIGPSIAIFDTIRNGKLDCVCVYPTPLHSREQMQGLVDHMKRILVEGSTK
ncbi:hypothetical protein Fmac_027444 [Flemingia macrophylla]|uniref:Uncharacterized protein n=1 Tax=Flemingia macrophylla TaxID=520843 RepID=A0ABD1LHP9_9FABA